MKGKGFAISILIALVLCAGLGFGLYRFLEWNEGAGAREWAEKMENDTSYKTKTKKNKSYNGIYTLTKLDKDGNNTWDGICLKVEHDKVVSVTRYECYTWDEFIEDYPKYKDEKCSLMTIDLVAPYSITPPEGEKEDVVYIFSPCITETHGAKVYPTGVFQVEGKVNYKDEYISMSECGIVAGYDEDSQEVWLSKLLKNKNSEYSKGYKLIHYKNYKDWDYNCPLSGTTHTERIL